VRLGRPALAVLPAFRGLDCPLPFTLESTAVLAPVFAALLALPLQQPSDAQIAEWIRADLASGAAPRASAGQRLADAGLRDDLSLAREVGGLVAGAGAQGVIVGAHDGQVVLHGRVRDEAQRERLLGLAAGVDGARGVTSKLLLPGEEPQAEAAAEAAPPAAAALARSESFAFLAGDVAARDVLVEVSDGLVTLSGTASSEDARRWATAVAGRVPGVRAVSNRMTARPGSREVDRRLALLVLREIEGDVLVQSVAPAIDVSAHDGIVRLTGKVRDAGQSERAAAVAAGLSAVFAVDNRLGVDEALTLPPSLRNQGFRTWRDR
jgi:osmotically-inducible protein OsmY